MMFGKSAQSRFFLIAAPIALVAILAAAVWNAKTGHDKQVYRLNAKLEHLIQNQTLVMAEIMTDSDKRLLKLVGAGIVADPDIGFVRIQDAEGNTVAELGDELTTEFIISRQINIRNDSSIRIGGTLTLGVSYAEVLAASMRSFAYSVIGALFAIFAIWLGGFLAFRHAVGRPIDLLHQLMESWRNNQWKEPDWKIPSDELGSLTTAFVELHETIQTRESELKSIKDGLELRVAERTEELKKRALTDSLTGLPNRSAAVDYANEKFGSPKIANEPVAVFAIDLDHFKELNDRHGHATGDKMLCHAANIIREHMGSSALVARMGGDEFVAICNAAGMDIGELEAFGNALSQKLSTPVHLDDFKCRIGGSVGIALCHNPDESFEQVLANADLALYDAKNAGRGHSCSFNEQAHAEFRHRRKLVNEVRRATERKEFEPYLQPQINLDTGKVSGFELLARWKRNEHEIISPHEFLTAVEDAGTTVALDQMILERGLDALVEMRSAGFQDLTISANASTASLKRSGYAENVLAALEQRGLVPADMVIEILEETVITDTTDQAMGAVQKLHASGIGIEMDDFGAGYSSFSQLALLPLNGLKIDRSLVQPLPGGPSQEILRAILALCKELKLEAITEGVETEEQLKILRELGCKTVQGYLLAKPMPLSDAISWLKAREEDAPIPRHTQAVSNAA